MWHSKNKLDGESKHLLHDGGVPALYTTRQRVRVWIMKHYGYIKTRRDLREEPHGWRFPQPVRVTVCAKPPKRRKG